MWAVFWRRRTWPALDSPGYAPEKAPDYYPPALMGMRGNHDGTFTYAHKLRDHKFEASAPSPEPTGETYDLIVVGGGISGLAAAHFYRKTAGKRRPHLDPRQPR